MWDAAERIGELQTAESGQNEPLSIRPTTTWVSCNDCLCTVVVRFHVRRGWAEVVTEGGYPHAESADRWQAALVDTQFDSPYSRR